jgi:hypothetical protein
MVDEEVDGGGALDLVKFHSSGNRFFFTNIGGGGGTSKERRYRLPMPKRAQVVWSTLLTVPPRLVSV